MAAVTRPAAQAQAAGAPQTNRSEASFLPVPQLDAKELNLFQKRWDFRDNRGSRIGVVGVCVVLARMSRKCRQTGHSARSNPCAVPARMSSANDMRATSSDEGDRSCK